MRQVPYSFTASSDSRQLSLRSWCGISAAWDPQSGAPMPEVTRFDAIWDTGSTGCVVTKTVVDACRLEGPTPATAFSVTGMTPAETYLVNLWLPSGASFVEVRAMLGELHGVTDILIGMDIINQGDFAVTNREGRTKFTFRVPSIADIDFEEQDRLRQRSESEP